MAKLHAGEGAGSDVRKRSGDGIPPSLTLAVAAFAAFLATFNETFLNVGFAPMMANLGVDVSTVQWLATAYMLGAAVMVPVSAFAYRSLPTRPLFCSTVALLVIGSVIGAIAPSFPIVLTGRIVQALGTGMLIPIGMNITLEIAPRERLGAYMGIMGAMTTLGPSSSMILAGAILAIWDWHMLFWTFAILSCICLVIGALALRDIAKLTHPRLDVVSVILIGLALIGILYGISTVFDGSIPIAIGSAVVGVILMILFIRRQSRLSDPLIDLRPLHIRPFTVGVIANMLALISIFAMNIIVPTFMQSVLGTEPLIASLILFPAILCSCGLSPVAGRLYDRSGPGVILPLGFACIAGFSALTGVLIPTASPIVLALVYIPVICGSALVIGPVQSFALSKLSFEMNPHGVTVMSTGFQIAGCIGSSVFTGIYAATSAASMAAGSGFDPAFSFGMLITCIAVGAVALAGFAISLWIGRSAAKAMSETSEIEKALSEDCGVPVDARIREDERWERDASAAAAEASELSKRDAIESIMKRDVYTLPEDASVADALELFVEKGISGAPIAAPDGSVIGFISDGDVMRRIADQVPAFKSAWSFIVEAGNADFDRTMEDAMASLALSIATRNVICMDADDDMGEVARTLSEHHLKKAPVVEGGRMVGMINRSNITDYVVRNHLYRRA